MKKLFKMFTIIALITVLSIGTCLTAQAKTTRESTKTESASVKRGIVYDEDGFNFRIYNKKGKMLTGLVKYGKYKYYLRKTSDEDFKRGQAVRNRCRIIKGKFYYFRTDGRMAKRTTHHRASLYEIGKDGAVKYIYKVRGRVRGCRYNCKRRCLEWEQEDGSWKKDKEKGTYIWDNTDLCK